MTITQEAAFEGNIESALVEDGWHRLEPTAYSRGVGLFEDEIIAFVQESQPKAWGQLVKRHGGEGTARQKFTKVVAAAIDHRGTISVLRSPVKDSGVTRPSVLLQAGQRSQRGADEALRREPARCRPSAASLGVQPVRLGRPRLGRQWHPRSDGGAEEPADGSGHRARDDAVPHGPQPARPDLRQARLGPLRCRPAPRRDDDEAGRVRTRGSCPSTWARPDRVGRALPATRSMPGIYRRRTCGGRSGSATPGSICSAASSTSRRSRILFPRFHQWHAVRSLIEATRKDGAGVDRLVQHSAGSGKSNTIAWTAHALSRLHGEDDQPIFDKVVVITDRRVLDRQLQETVAGLDHTPGHHRADRPALQSAQGRVGGQRCSRHHHDAPEVPGGRQARCRGSRGW